jgi:ubiquinone/menaquinone biosynthesis C-methylase UbiE
LELQTKAAKLQLEGVDLKQKEVLDVGCGTGALSLLALERGAAKVVCGDISGYMLEQCNTNAAAKGFGADRIDFRQLDAESLPFEDGGFDVVLTGMTLGLLPNQEKAVAEMVRVARPGGEVSVGAHGPEHYWEAIDACFRVISKRHVLGYRLEFWPRKETEVRRMFARAGLVDIRTRRVLWRNSFETGGEAYDFFGAISASFWYAKLPPDVRTKDSQQARSYFDRKGVTRITDDIILAYGRKP